MSAYLEWFVLYMMVYPDVQERCFRELNSIVGDKHAVVEDRSKTHFLEATLLEIMRHCPHMALTVQHYAVADVTIGGHFIPKGTQVP